MRSALAAKIYPNAEKLESDLRVVQVFFIDIVQRGLIAPGDIRNYIVTNGKNLLGVKEGGELFSGPLPASPTSFSLPSKVNIVVPDF